MKKLLTTMLATSAVAAGLLFAGTSADASTTYTVKAGDSVWAISQKFNTTISALESANHITGHFILPGQKLTIGGTTADNQSTTTTTTTTQPSTTTASATTQSSANSTASTNATSASTTSQSTANTASAANTATATSASATNTATSTASSTASTDTTSSTDSTSTSSSSSSSDSTYTGSNLKSYVLSQMESRTGVSASTWNTIITRESNWETNVVNSSSGAYGLFQNMHISSGSVEDQVNAAVSLYEAQGMSAWAL